MILIMYDVLKPISRLFIPFKRNPSVIYLAEKAILTRYYLLLTYLRNNSQDKPYVTQFTQSWFLLIFYDFQQLNYN